MSKGIDYGLGVTNIDLQTGIRYGVINQHEVLQAWCDSSEADYGEPHCGRCGNEAVAGDSPLPDDLIAEIVSGETVPVGHAAGESISAEDAASYDRSDLGYDTLHHACGDYACDDCRVLFDAEDAFGDEPLGFTLDDGEYKASSGQDGDIFILQSPYYTRAAFCSPCAPGACYLASPCDDGEKAYCFGHDWFSDHPEHPGRAPYPVFRVSDDQPVLPE